MLDDLTLKVGRVDSLVQAYDDSVATANPTPPQPAQPLIADALRASLINAQASGDSLKPDVQIAGLINQSINELETGMSENISQLESYQSKIKTAYSSYLDAKNRLDRIEASEGKAGNFFRNEGNDLKTNALNDLVKRMSLLQKELGNLVSFEQPDRTRGGWNRGFDMNASTSLDLVGLSESILSLSTEDVGENGLENFNNSLGKVINAGDTGGYSMPKGSLLRNMFEQGTMTVELEQGMKALFED